MGEQSREVRKAKQQVQTVFQSIEIMRSKNLATIANITAGAQADAKEIQARALRTAFNLKQHTKATEYAELQRARAGFSPYDRIFEDKSSLYICKSRRTSHGLSTNEEY